MIILIICLCVDNQCMIILLRMKYEVPFISHHIGGRGGGGFENYGFHSHLNIEQ